MYLNLQARLRRVVTIFCNTRTLIQEFIYRTFSVFVAFVSTLGALQVCTEQRGHQLNGHLLPTSFALPVLMSSNLNLTAMCSTVCCEFSQSWCNPILLASLAFELVMLPINLLPVSTVTLSMVSGCNPVLCNTYIAAQTYRKLPVLPCLQVCTACWPYCPKWI